METGSFSQNVLKISQETTLILIYETIKNLSNSRLSSKCFFVRKVGMEDNLIGRKPYRVATSNEDHFTGRQPHNTILRSELSGKSH